MATPTFGGQAIFGKAVSILMTPYPNDVQKAAFWGVNGVYQITGGARGRRFNVSGLLYGPNTSAVISARTLFLSYADGVQRALYDCDGLTWAQVVFNGEFEWTGRYGYGGGTLLPSVYRPYRATFEGLS